MLRSTTKSLRSLRLLVVLSMLIGTLGPVAHVSPAYAASVTTASFASGDNKSVIVGGTLYAKNGASVVLNVTTSADTQCVAVTGAHTDIAKKDGGMSSWQFNGGNFVAGPGNGVQTVTVTAYPNYIQDHGTFCTGTPGTPAGSASYVLDNAGPVVTAGLSPTPNAAGWNNTNVAITWGATDAGSGVGSGPTPATDSVTTNTAGTTKTATAADRLSNTGSGSVTVKVDKTAPTISASRVPTTGNSFGWNNTNVTVSFVCSDTGPSGIKSCPGSTTLSADGGGQSVTGTALDTADNSASATVSNINIDKTAPTLTGAPTTSASADGWYSSNVTIHWTPVDAVSGIDPSTVPADSVISGEGSGLTAGASVKDKAGNQTTASSPSVSIDRTAPNTTASAPPAWNNSDVTVNLNANDALSGVKASYFTLDGGAQVTYTTGIVISAEGIHNLQYWSVDKAGNVEATKSAQVKIDRTSPTISHALSPLANANGWNNTNVTVTFTCNDSLSGIASCTGPQTKTAEGQNQPVPGTATDNANNTATDPALVSIDKTAPTISAAPDRAANANGWYNHDVIVSFTCADSLSGIDNCPAAQTLGEGANQSASGTAIDAAGNTAGAGLTGLNVDETAPTLSGAPTTAPNAAGWYKGDVTIHWSASDQSGLSGIDSTSVPANSVIAGEGVSLVAGASVKDLAGNTTGANSAAVKIDRTAPSTTSDAPAGWNNHDVTVSLVAGDNLSEVKTTYFTLDGGSAQAGNIVTIGAEGDHTLEFWSVDKADNVEASKTVHVKIDKLSPTINHTLAPPANANGWNKTDVTVTFNCADALSGLASCTGPRTLTEEGQNQPAPGVAVDNAGNDATDPATVSIDKSAPTVSAAPDRPANSFGWYKDDVIVSFTCADNLSGIDNCPAAKTLGEGANQSASGTAVDAAGNTAGAGLTGINVDKTAPSLGGAPTTGPNADGWYNANVTIHWTASDGLSGIDSATLPTDSVIAGEDTGLTAGASVSDRAGNSTTATSSPAVNIDRTAPNTTADAPPAWNNIDVTVSLDANDSLSGVKTTYFVLDGGAQQVGTSIHINAQGIHTLQYWSVDKAGNVEAAKTAQIKIDRTSPTISHVQAPAANGNGWNNTDVVVTFTCGDDFSGVASCTEPQTKTTEGIDTTVVGTAVDNAGNSATDPALVSIDKTAPTISAAPDRAANANGWYNDDVTVSFTCADILSGVDNCSDARTLGEGGNQTAQGDAMDAAGNTAHIDLTGINVDKTAPTLSGAPTTAPNAAGWYNGNVTIRWSCGDALSGVAGPCPSNSTIAGEGDALSAVADVSDLAGNSTTATSTAVKIDRTAPHTTATAPGGWNNQDVSVVFNANDALSGVNATYYKVDGGAEYVGGSLAVSAEGVHTVEFWSVDEAGNVEAANAVQVRIDKTSPTITHTQAPAANANGWNNSGVTVTFTCADQPGLSGVASCTGPQTVTEEGNGLPAPGAAVDNAGNSASDPATVNIDRTPPTIGGAPDREPDSNGWYNANVTVSFTCADALSGVDTCESPRLLATDGASQSANGTTVDAAGNSASATVSGIKIDRLPPTLGSAPTTNPNAAGWYKDDVTISWSAADQEGLSGIDPATVPADSAITGEGVGLTAGASVSDLAGNSTNAASAAVKIDRTAPNTTVSAPSDWVNNSVTVTLDANDSLSGVKATYFALDSPTAQAYHSGAGIAIHTEGMHTLRFWSVDNADNAEAIKDIQVRIDRTAPTIHHSLSPEANENGWNNTNVTVHFTCSDALSGISSCTGIVGGNDTGVTVTTEGQGQPVPGTAVDNAGNTATDPANVSVDQTAPTIGAAPDRPANSFGWYNDDVTVSYTCGDSLSGVRSCSSPQTLGEGADQTASGIAVDAAGNTAGASLTGINVDETAPSLAGAPTTSPNGAGWYNGDVTVHWTAADQDGLSGIDPATLPADSAIAGDGDNLSASASVSDKAGNTTNATVAGIKIDRTAPGTSSDAPTGWNNNDVVVSLSADDALSGVKATHYRVDGGAAQTGVSVAINTEGNHTLQFWSEDNAGNVEAAKTLQVKIDKTNPAITHALSPAANANGWNNSDVTVTFTCSDQPELSGVASCTDPQTVTEEGQNQPVPGTAVDNAGNTATDPATVSVDKTAPTISAAPDRSANSFGWYNDDVTVEFTCGDSLSGVANCSPAQMLDEGAAQGAGGTATDAAGNTAATSLSDINVDKTPPTLGGAPTTSPNGAGWYNGDVTVHWTAADQASLSGLDPATVPADSIVTGEGANLSAAESVSDKAGNTTNAAVAGIKIDRTAPKTTVTAPSGWVNHAVTMTLDADDTLSGVGATYFMLDGGAQQTGTGVTIGTEGVHTLRFWSVDNANNVEAVKDIQVRIDRTDPTITHTLSPAANADGWNNTDVTVHFTCADPVSGIASCTGIVNGLNTGVTKTTEGQDQPVPGTAVDNAGNAATDPAAVSVDKTAPTISGAPDRAANGFGWYKDDVTVSFTCGDSLSGVRSCSGPQMLHEGASQSAGGSATDAAGNGSSASAGGINVDETAPSLSGAPTSSPNAAGWYNGDVTVHWTALDGLSGINPGTVPADSVITGEGADLSASASVGDKAGSTTNSTVAGIKIDRTAPSTGASAPSGWRNTDVTVTLNANDALSGVGATYYRVDGGSQQTYAGGIVIGAQGVHTLEYWSVDRAGNGEVAKSLQVRIDKTAPTIAGAPTTAPNANGWYKGPVTAHFTCGDPAVAAGTPGSGIANCQPDVTLTGSGANQGVTGTAVDNAGNSASVTVSGINIDTSGPVVTIGGVADGGVYTLGAVPAASCSAADPGSGVAGSCTGTLTGGTPNGVGSYTYTASATDRAGNTQTVTARYRVIYRFDGFLQPVNDTAHQIGTSTSIFRAGSTVPMKFQLKRADGTLVQANSLPQWLTPARGSTMAGAVNEGAYTDPVTTSGTYRSETSQYIYNWGTSGNPAGYYYRVGVRLDDGQTYYVNVGLR